MHTTTAEKRAQIERAIQTIRAELEYPSHGGSYRASLQKQLAKYEAQLKALEEA